MHSKTKIAVFVMLVLMGALGAYELIKSGVDSPFVWALSGKWAPALWFSLLGIFLLSIFNANSPNCHKKTGRGVCFFFGYCLNGIGRGVYFFFEKMLDPLYEYALYELTSKAGYSAMFKAFLLLITLYTLSIYEISKLVLDVDMKLYVSEVQSIVSEAESDNGATHKIIIDDKLCRFESISKPSQRLESYRQGIIETINDTFAVFRRVVEALMYFFGFISVAGFVVHPFLHKK